MSDAVKMAEAEKLMKKAKDHTTKSITRWTCDWDTGASEYEKAALIYRNLNRGKEAVAAFELSAQCFEKANVLYMAGKNLEAAGTILKDASDNEKAVNFYVRAAKMYAMDSKVQPQADVLKKAAMICGGGAQASDASNHMKDAITALEDGEKWHAVPDIYRAWTILLVRNGMYQEAMAARKQQNKSLQHMENAGQSQKNCLEVVILALALGDDVLAEREFRELSENGYGFQNSREQAVGYDLINAIQEGDAERLKEVIKEQTITFLVPDVARLVKKLKVSGTGVKKPADAATAEPSAPRLVGTTAAKPEEENSSDSDDCR